MASPDDDRDDLTRRTTLKGMGAVLGTAAVSCGDDGSGEGSSGGSTGGSTSGSTGVADSSGSGEDSSGTGTDTGERPPIEACADPSGMAPEELLGQVDTIVVVMMENRSFDHYFGSSTFLEDFGVDGLTGDEQNLMLDGTPVPVFPLDNLTPADPPHSWGSSHLQWNMGNNDGFVTEHEQEHPGSAEEVMGYHVRAQLPVLYALADNYVLCDRWFSSVMGPTWPNRFYLNCASSGGQMVNEAVPRITTIWDVLGSEGISGTNYYSDLPWLWGGLASTGQSYVDNLEAFFDAAAAGTLPSFCIVEPNYGLLGGEGGNDDHPSHDITLGQIFLGSVYQALAQSPQWERCLLIITYDEHGGFYDHVAPPTATDEIPEFQQLGFRVPSLVIGPHVRRGCVDGTQFDHVTPIATATRRFGLPPLNDRVGDTNDVSSAIDPEYLGNPQPPAALPMMSVSVREVLSKRGTGQEELAGLVARGEIPLPADRRHAGAGRQIAARLLERAQRLGVVKLRP